MPAIGKLAYKLVGNTGHFFTFAHDSALTLTTPPPVVITPPAPALLNDWLFSTASSGGGYGFPSSYWKFGDAYSLDAETGKYVVTGHKAELSDSVSVAYDNDFILMAS